MAKIAEPYITKGELVSGEEMLNELQKNLNATINKNDLKKYVVYTDPKAPIGEKKKSLSKAAYGQRLRHIRNWSRKRIEDVRNNPI